MSRFDDRSPGDGSYPRCIESLRTTHDEARTVLDHQIATLNDIDDKAARTVRVTALLLGAVLSAPSVLADPEPFVNVATKWGTSSLVLAVVTGTFTYSVSSPHLGPGPNDIEWMLERRFREDEWLAILLESYADWIDWTDWLNGFNAVYLALTQASLGIGLVLLTVGVFDGLGTSVQLLSVSVYSLPVQLVATLCCVGILASAVRKMRGARA